MFPLVNHKMLRTVTVCDSFMPVCTAVFSTQLHAGWPALLLPSIFQCVGSGELPPPPPNFYIVEIRKQEKSLFYYELNATKSVFPLISTYPLVMWPEEIQPKVSV